MTRLWSAAVSDSSSELSVGPLWDTSGDGRISSADWPYVLFNSEWYVVALDGRTGAAFWSTAFRVFAIGGAPVVVDLEGDRSVEVVQHTGATTAGDAIDKALVIYGHSGEIRDWGDTLGTEHGGDDTLAVANVDGVGAAEILKGRTIVASEGALFASGAYAAGAMPSRGQSSYGVDLDADGVAEVLAGPSAYHGDGTLMWDNAELPDGHSFVADFDGDLEPDVLLVSDGLIWGLDATNGEAEWGPVALEGACDGSGATSSGAIEDLDDNGVPEFIIPCGARVAAYTWGGGVLWSTSVGSAPLGSVTVADLDGDGVPELGFESADGVFILAGSNGHVRWHLDRGDVTRMDAPVFADVDLDGTIEMIIATPSATTSGAEVSAWRANPAGPGHRNVWNSHSYHIRDINDDMTVPDVSEPYWLTTNSFRSAGLGERAPDIALSPRFVDVCELECAWGRLVLTGTLANAGSEPSPAGVEVVLTAGPGGRVLATAITTQEVPPYSTSEEALRFEIRFADLDGQLPTLEVDPEATRLQCLTWPEDDLTSWVGGGCE